MNRNTCIGLLVALSAISAAGFADTIIVGSGPTRTAAADDANERARYESQRRFKRDDCYLPANAESCRRTSSGDYICTALVPNRMESCR
ncbi:MAG TPA: hypothetical protein VIL43_12330 [Burkholderiales bacterium]